MQQLSFWLQQELPAQPNLQGAYQTDVLVIGGGLAGLQCALQLREAGLDTLLLEAGRLGRGTSGHTTAKVSLQHGVCYSNLTKLWGEDVAKQYAVANKNAQEAIASYAQHGCSLTRADSFLYTRNPSLVAQLEEESRAAQKAGLPMRLQRQSPLPFSVAGTLCLPGQIMLHPLEYMRLLCKKLTGCLYENSRVIRLENNIAFTHGGSVRAKHIIVATHYPFINTPGYYFLKLYQSRSAVLALSKAPVISGMHIALEENGLSLRMQEDYLILGSSSGWRCGTREKTAHFKQLCQQASALFPKAAIEFAWAAQDCMPPDGLPYIGSYSAGLSEIYVATGFHKWGLTQSMLAAQIITGEILRRPLPYAGLFSPARSKLPGLPSLLKSDGNMVGYYMRGLPRFDCPTCSHLGCRLVFNPEEQTWDCPAHGSRFSEEGDILEGPTTRGLNR